MKTRNEIEALKRGWQSDPCWDIETTEGFEAHRDELLAYRNAAEVQWEQNRQQREAEIDAKADALGARGLYRMVLALQDRLAKLEDATGLLCDGEQQQAWDALRGYSH